MTRCTNCGKESHTFTFRKVCVQGIDHMLCGNCVEILRSGESLQPEPESEPKRSRHGYGYIYPERIRVPNELVVILTDLLSNLQIEKAKRYPSTNTGINDYEDGVVEGLEIAIREVAKRLLTPF